MADSSKIAIFPAAGALGTSVYTHLAKLISPSRIVLVSRNPDKIPKTLVDAGAETRQADYNKPQSLAGVFEDVSYLFLISYPSIEVEHRFESHKAAVSAAIKSNPNLKHVFYTSLAFAGKDDTTSEAHVMQAHLRTEAWLRELVKTYDSLSFTVIREGIYSETWPMYTGFFDPKGQADEIVLPHDGKAPGIAWVAIGDLGEASARLVQEFLEQPDRYTDKTVLLSGPKAWSLDETVQLLSKVAGREIAIRQGSFEDYSRNPRVVEALGSHGPGDAAGEWTTIFEAIRRGETSVVTDDLERLLGRPAESFETTVTRMVGQ